MDGWMDSDVMVFIITITIIHNHKKIFPGAEHGRPPARLRPQRLRESHSLQGGYRRAAHKLYLEK